MRKVLAVGWCSSVALAFFARGRGLKFFHLQEIPILRHCLHERRFICNRIGFDAVTHFVYSAPVEFVISNGSF